MGKNVSLAQWVSKASKNCARQRIQRDVFTHEGVFFHKKKKEYSLYTILLLKVVDFHLISHIASTNKIDQSTGEGDEN